MNIYAMKKPRRINSVSVGLLIIALTLVYATWAFVPVLWPLWRMSGIMRAACASAYRTLDDDPIMQDLLEASKRTRLRVTRENFHLERVPFAPEELAGDVVGDREQHMRRGRECVLRFRYVGNYTLPLLGLTYRLPYESTVRVDLRPANTKTNPLHELFYESCTCTRVPPGGGEAR